MNDVVSPFERDWSKEEPKKVEIVHTNDRCVVATIIGKETIIKQLYVGTWNTQCTKVIEPTIENILNAIEKMKPIVAELDKINSEIRNYLKQIIKYPDVDIWANRLGVRVVDIFTYIYYPSDNKYIPDWFIEKIRTYFEKCKQHPLYKIGVDTNGTQETI